MSIKHALLALLADEPKYGLQLKQDFELNTGEIWPLNVGQVYSTLQRLEKDGFVSVNEVQSDASQTVYSLTEKGETELKKWLSESEFPPPPRDELVIKILVALTLDNVDVSAIIQDHRQSCVETMQEYTKVKKDSDSTSLTLAIDAEIFRIEAIIRWLDSVEIRIEKGLVIQRPKRSTYQVTEVEESEQEVKVTNG